MWPKAECCGQWRRVDSLRLPDTAWTTLRPKGLALPTLPTARLRRGLRLTSSSQRITITTPQSGTGFGAKAPSPPNGLELRRLGFPQLLLPNLAKFLHGMQIAADPRSPPASC